MKGLKLIRRMEAAGLIRWAKPPAPRAPSRWTMLRDRIRRALWPIRWRLARFLRPKGPAQVYITCETVMAYNPALRDKALGAIAD